MLLVVELPALLVLNQEAEVDPEAEVVHGVVERPALLVVDETMAEDWDELLIDELACVDHETKEVAADEADDDGAVVDDTSPGRR